MWKPVLLQDVDDCMFHANGGRYGTIERLNREIGSSYTIDDVRSWGLTGKPIDYRLKYFEEPDFYREQEVMPGAQEYLRKLMKKADVMLVTAVPAHCMEARIKRISEVFPFFPMDHVIMGTRKDVVHGDVMVDDGLHNLLVANASLPIVFDQPWNREVSGMCRARGYDEILTIVDFLTGAKLDYDITPKVVCIVGPSGSGKNALADELCKDEGFRRVGTVTTALKAPSHGVRVSDRQYKQMAERGLFLEATTYTGDNYGIVGAHIEAAMNDGVCPVAVMDVAGCMSIYNKYPGRCKIFYVDAPKRDCISSVISKVGLSREQVTNRILSMDYEIKNKVLADHIIEREDVAEMARKVKELI